MGGNRVVLELAVTEFADAAADAEIGVDELSRRSDVAGDDDVPFVDRAIAVAGALLNSREAGGLFLQGFGSLLKEKLETHLLDLGFEALAGERIVDAGIVAVGLG